MTITSDISIISFLQLDLSKEKDNGRERKLMSHLESQQHINNGKDYYVPLEKWCKFTLGERLGFIEETDIPLMTNSPRNYNSTINFYLFTLVVNM